MKRNLKQYMGMCLLLILSMVSGHTALAANTWKMAAKELTKNAQTTLSLQLENSDAVNAFQFDLTLPTGLKLTDKPILNATRSSGHILDWTTLSKSKYRCIVYSLSNANLEGNSGELLSIPVRVDTLFAGGEVALTDMVLTNQKAVELPVSANMGKLSVKKQYIQLSASGLTQKARTITEPVAKITVITIPAGLIDSTNIQYSPSNPRNEGIYTVKVSRGEDSLYYKVDTTFRMVLVGKDQPTVSGIKATPLNEGQRLAQSILSGGSATKAVKEGEESSPVPGKFVWLNPEQVVSAPAPDEETVTYTALFIPTDESHYANVEVPVKVTVNPVYHVYFLPQAGGSLQIEGEHADQTYVAGQTLKVRAFPDPNYEFVKWIGLDGTDENLKNPEQEIPITSDMTISPTFERPKYKVTMLSPNYGALTATCDGIALKYGDNYCAKGSTILVQYTPNENSVLESLKIGGVERTKYVVQGDVTIEAKTKWQESPLTITTTVSGEGSIRLFNTDGKSILPGSALTEGSQFTVISVPEPGCELETLEVKGATLADGKYTLTGETTVTAKFKRSSYELTANHSGTGTLTITPQKAKYDYGDQVTITASDGDLYRLVVNGKAIESGQLYTITGNTNVYAKFLVREKLNPDFIKQDAQSYVFNNQYQRFEVNLSNIYAYWDFNVSYPGLAAGEQAPVNTGKYAVRITREADQNYEAFQLDLPNSLEIKKAKIRVTEAPTSVDKTQTTSIGKTSPQYGNVQIEQDANKSYLYKFTYTPKEADAANYEPVVYYYSNSDTKYKLSLGNTATLKSTEVPGYVLVTNGNMVVEDLNAIPEGTMLTLQAIANPNNRFMGWKIGGASEISKTDNPIEIPLESNLTYEPVFEGKAALTATLTQNEFDYIEGTPNVEITVKDGDEEVSGVQFRFFAEEACTTSIEPTNVKNVGTYYVQAYRAEDDLYQELKKIFSFTIKAVKPSTITWPDASNIVEGESLAASILTGGNANSIPGSFAWKEGQTISGAGEKTPTVVFTPLDPNYTSCEGTVKLNVLSTTSSTTETKEPVKPSDPTTPDTPEEPEKPTVTPPVVTERTPTTAVITWDKVEGATAYKLFLYAKKGDTTPLMTYEFDANGQLKASAISFNLTGLEEGKSYYVKTVAYQGEEVLVEQAIALSATPTAIERIADAVQITTTKGMIHVTLATPLSVRVLSMSGLTLYEQADAVGSVEISVGNAGVYAVILYKGHEVLLQKVIVR